MATVVEKAHEGLSFCEYLLKHGTGVIISADDYRGDQLEWLAACASEGNASLVIKDIQKANYIKTENINNTVQNGKGHVTFDLTDK